MLILLHVIIVIMSFPILGLSCSVEVASSHYNTLVTYTQRWITEDKESWMPDICPYVSSNNHTKRAYLPCSRVYFSCIII